MFINHLSVKEREGKETHSCECKNTCAQSSEETSTHPKIA